MINSKTVFIVGAGASKEAKLPPDWELAEILSKKLRVEEDATGRFAEAIAQMADDEDIVTEADD